MTVHFFTRIEFTYHSLLYKKFQGPVCNRTVFKSRRLVNNFAILTTAGRNIIIPIVIDHDFYCDKTKIKKKEKISLGIIIDRPLEIRVRLVRAPGHNVVLQYYTI